MISGVSGPDDPDRCQAMTANGQCMRKRVLIEGCHVCPIHGGVKHENRERNNNVRNYRLAKWQAKIDEKSSSSGIKSLREEIGILRILMEERMATCHDASDLILQSGPISDLVMKIEKVVASCHKLEGAMGQLLDKQAILQFASQVINIISELVPDPALVNEIADRITQSLGEVKNEE